MLTLSASSRTLIEVHREWVEFMEIFCKLREQKHSKREKNVY